MSSKPTPYAFAPTKNGQKLPWELGIPEDGRVLPPVPTRHRNTSGSTSTQDHHHLLLGHFYLG